MKIVVIGGSGFIGVKLVEALRDAGHEVVAASPSSGVDTMTGAGLTEALSGARVVLDASNSPSLSGAAAMEFFRASARNLAAAEKAAGVAHHITLSIVGVDRLDAETYFGAKRAQEASAQTSSIPYTIVRSTQFFEFIEQIVETSSIAETVRIPRAWLQPIASDDAVTALVEFALDDPMNDIVEIGGPESILLEELASQLLSAREIPRRIVIDSNALYFGAPLAERSLLAGPNARLSFNTYGDWLRQMIAAG